MYGNRFPVYNSQIKRIKNVWNIYEERHNKVENIFALTIVFRAVWDCYK